MFSKLLTKSDVQKSLLIPTCSSDVFPFEEGHSFYMNVVDQTGKSWIFPCFVQQNSDDQSIGSSTISVGWLKFAWHKDVRVGDMVFLHQKPLDADNSSGLPLFRIEVRRKIRLLGQDIWAAADQ